MGRGKGREHFGVGAGETGLVSLSDQLRKISPRSGLGLNSFVESLNILLQDVAESLAPQDIFPKLILGGTCSDSFSLPFTPSP